MLSLEIYKILHIGSLVATLGAQAAMIGAISGGNLKKDGAIKFFSAVHGIGMVLLLISGFGMLARLNYTSWPLWFYFKIALYLVVGGLMALIFRQGKLKYLLFMFIITFASIGAYLGIMKPFTE